MKRRHYVLEILMTLVLTVAGAFSCVSKALAAHDTRNVHKTSIQLELQGSIIYVVIESDSFANLQTARETVLQRLTGKKTAAIETDVVNASRTGFQWQSKGFVWD